MSASAPDAPPLSETTIGCFIRLFFWIAACIILAIWSEAPPAPAATTISTGLLGSQAAAGAAANMIASAAAPPIQVFLISAIVSSLEYRGPAGQHPVNRFLSIGRTFRRFVPRFKCIDARFVDRDPWSLELAAHRSRHLDQIAFRRGGAPRTSHGVTLRPAARHSGISVRAFRYRP